MKIHPLLSNGRFCFVVGLCSHCEVWKSFIERINAELKFDKRIQVIDCTDYHDFGITTNPIIKLFAPYINNEYPIMFINFSRKDGTNTRVEAEAWLRAMLHDDFLEPRYNEFMFNKECEFGERGIFRKKIMCV